MIRGRCTVQRAVVDLERKTVAAVVVCGRCVGHVRGRARERPVRRAGHDCGGQVRPFQIAAGERDILLWAGPF
jgi:hypothetical protein